MQNLLDPREQETEGHWVSISDVMSGLMVIFLFVAISYMWNVRLKADEIIVYKDEVESLLDAYKSLQAALHKELHTEFEGNLAKKRQFREVWRGHLDVETHSIRFKKPFTQGDATVPNDFKNTLRDFFPRYIGILTKPEYRDGIAEIRIEGHTSSEWFSETASDDSYINNMELSQNRARNVLYHVLQIAHPTVSENRELLKKKLTANGLSSSQLVVNLASNTKRPANSYTTIAMETGIPEAVVKNLHLEVGEKVREWWGNRFVTREELVNTVSSSAQFSDFKTEAIERAVNLLMENREDSRRVEFRVVTKSEKLISEIEELMKRFNKVEAGN